MIPFTRALGAILARQTTRPTRGMRTVGLHGGAMDGKNISLACVHQFVALAHLATQHNLHFNTARERLSLGRDGVAPNKQAGVASWIFMHPFQFQNKIAIGLLGAQHASGNSGAKNFAVLRAPCFWGSVDIHPAG